MKRKYVRVQAGQRFGRLVTLRPTGGRRAKSVEWICTCDCGRYHAVAGAFLTGGQIKSCGCARREALNKYKKKGRTDISAEDRAAIVRDIVLGVQKRVDVARDLGVTNTTIGLWLRAAGIPSQGVRNRKPGGGRRPDISMDERAAIVRDIESGVKQRVDAARDLGVTPSTICVWMKKARPSGG